MIIPPALKPNDIVGFVSPSRVITTDQINQAVGLIKEWHLGITFGEHMLSKEGYFAGTDDQRLSDLQTMIDDPSIKAIFCTRGGYGLTRIIDNLDLSKLEVYPKWIVGFSDITALHLKLYKANIASIHGVMPVQYDYHGIEQSIETLRQFLLSTTFNYTWSSHEYNIGGFVEGEVVGGNLSLLVESLGTSSELETTGRILLIEEIDEYLYKTDRMLNQLKRAGKFDNITGVIIGSFSEMKDTVIPFGLDKYEMINHYFSNLSVPVAFESPFGHTSDNYAIPFGYPLKLEVTRNEVTLKGSKP